jgi:hypothetical protein
MRQAVVNEADVRGRFRRKLRKNRRRSTKPNRLCAYRSCAPGLGSFETHRYPTLKGGLFMAATVTPSLVHQFSAMKPADFGRTIEPKWQVAQKLVKDIQTAVEKEQLTPLDGARTISSLTATLFGYDEFILREVSPETLLANTPPRR